MFCGNCGANNPDGAAVCSACGAQLVPMEEARTLPFSSPVPAAAPEEEPPRAPETPSSPAGEGTPAPLGRAGIVFYSIFGVAAAAIIFLAVVLSGRSPQTTAVQAAEAYFKPGTSALYSLVPKEVMAANGVSKTEFRAAAKTADMNFKIAHTALEASLGSDIHYSVQVRNKKSAGSEELLDAQTYYAENYGLKVTDAGLVKVRVTAVAGEDDDTYNLRIPVVKVGLNWYLDGRWATVESLEGYEEVLSAFDLT